MNCTVHRQMESSRSDCFIIEGVELAHFRGESQSRFRQTMLQLRPKNGAGVARGLREDT